MRTFYRIASRFVDWKGRSAVPGDAIHVIIPHCANWRLTQCTVSAFLRLSRRPCAVTVVNNYDSWPERSAGAWFEDPRIALIGYEWNLLGKIVQTARKTRSGSEENAQALDLAVARFPNFKWALMSHSDSAPLVKNWDDAYFTAISDGLILGNCRDRTRIHAAHASGTLFSQSEWVKRNGSTKPVYRDGDLALDVGDQVSVLLHDLKKSPVPVLPNTQNFPELLSWPALTNHTLREFAENGSCLTFDADRRQVVFGHMGRGTPRNLNDPAFKQKLPVDLWIELVDSI